MTRVCAVIVTRNRKDLLRGCLRSVLAQTRPADRILVVDNASTDGTREMLDSEFGHLKDLGILWRLDQKENGGGSGGVSAGMRWVHCNKIDWAWVMHDGVELEPDCLKQMLRVEAEADMIQVRIRHENSRNLNFSGSDQVIKVDYCDFTAALIHDRAIEAAGFPDIRYFNARDDSAYGQLIGTRCRSVCLNYEGVIRNITEPETEDRCSYYLGIRNLFLNRDNLKDIGGIDAGTKFAARILAAVMRQLGRAAESGGRGTALAMATIDGLRDGIHKRFDRLPSSDS